jgi:acetyl-CoA carboxylase carboxyl transferase subunit beta
MVSVDFLEFKDSKSYKARIDAALAKGGSKDAIICGEGKIEGLGVQLAVFDFSFMGGSMGSVVGEKITRVIERGLKEGTPVIVVSASGGARMQESILSLMQMAKTSAALAKMKAKGLPFISILTDPTTGGVTASFAMLGDVNMAEPKALIGFAGPRVIEQTIRQKLPEGFQRAEYLLDHGMVDIIVERKDMKASLSKILGMLCRVAA